ncbi:hypothetical protein [Candidatus Enterovibrio escicola]|uniref:Mobile element protein n=1 Tax=Candidatus Enterovibrio escicola TaxID=1927127 RepID=A0A2A5T0D0_9GAMM|nr:hypothetical protein [Candidatus Enterovibrio escacola]PCS21627.1 hypothetical protein BTN49_2788 [Candidatus Enterovibrio escacola]
MFYSRPFQFNLATPKLILCNYNAQVGKSTTNMKAMNKVIRLGIAVLQQTN